MPCLECRCSRFIRNVMEALHVNELAEKHPDASDIDLAFGEIERLQRVDKLVRKIHERWGSASEELFHEIDKLID